MTDEERFRGGELLSRIPERLPGKGAPDFPMRIYVQRMCEPTPFGDRSHVSEVFLPLTGGEDEEVVTAVATAAIAELLLSSAGRSPEQVAVAYGISLERLQSACADSEHGHDFVATDSGDGVWAQSYGATCIVCGAVEDGED